MTVKHYLVANKRLKQGKYGSKPLWIRFPAEEIDDNELRKVYFRQMHEWKGQKYWLIYKTKDDYLGIAIERRKDLILSHVTNKFVYELDCPDERLAYEALFRFAEEQLWFGEKIELYTCYDGEEDAARLTSCDTVIHLDAGLYISGGASFPISKEDQIADLARKFRWCDRQYVEIQR
ncbi:hypothetical protein [Terribacillus saccharophilus]|uniref:Uncharacterized protein n=1 Tax=Terribacillus saccharophilus TaxID=361277 RepID=A0A268A8Y4_9BACI|nr:hypothetical protein [Terribacillus saccharophilus]PAD20591.1 hypothetical protein CHH64_13730 [Terribacillus saccharophilus]PAF17765.1 hypothetical protein CHH51_10860 [Terribacillus saccharophilus]PAF39113.1 hypothetical protein CHH58_00195 [Terribacillus saccharophilus]